MADLTLHDGSYLIEKLQSEFLLCSITCQWKGIEMPPKVRQNFRGSLHNSYRAFTMFDQRKLSF